MNFGYFLWSITLYKITLITGLPGSGKTFLATKMAIENDAIVIDDIRETGELPKTNCDCNIVITDINLCDSRILDMCIDQLTIRYPMHVLNVIYFENDPDACRANVVRRNDGRDVEGSIRRFTAVYNPPVDALSVYKR